MPHTPSGHTDLNLSHGKNEKFGQNSGLGPKLAQHNYANLCL